MDFKPDFIHKLQKQDHTAFNELYLKTVDIFFRYIHANYTIPGPDAQDIISDFYVKVWEAVKHHDTDQSFSGYLWMIFKNTIKDYFKKNTDIPFTELESPHENANTFEDSLVDETDFSHFLENDFKFEKIQHAMKELDDMSKDIIYRKFIEEKSYEEMALLLGLSQENIRQKISRAIKRLKELLERRN